MNPEPNQVTEHNVLTDEYTYRPFTDEEQAENDSKETAEPLRPLGNTAEEWSPES